MSNDQLKKTVAECIKDAWDHRDNCPNLIAWAMSEIDRLNSEQEAKECDTTKLNSNSKS